MARRIAVVTGTRAEFGLMHRLMRLLADDPAIELSVVATGMHLAPEFGLTVREIEAAGLPVDRRVDMLLSGDSPRAIAKSTGLGIIGMADALDGLKPDLVLLLGDRFEIYAAASAATLMGIPLAHIHGGEITEGAVDEMLRHAITKMAHLHFTSTADYRRRVIQLGEAPERVFDVGALGVENARCLDLVDRAELARTLGFPAEGPIALTTFHPATLEGADPAAQMGELLAALEALPDLRVVFTKANADAGGRVINAVIDAWVAGHADRAVAYTSMGQRNYFSAMSCATLVLGNSSSGLLEAPSFRVPTVNIGARQRGRLRAASVFDCAPEKGAILAAIGKARAAAAAIDWSSPYDKPGTAAAIATVLRDHDLAGFPIKQFHDLAVTAQ